MFKHLTGKVTVSTGLRSVTFVGNEYDPDVSLMGLRAPARLIVQYEAGPEGNEAGSMWEDVETDEEIPALVEGHLTYIDDQFSIGHTFAA